MNRPLLLIATSALLALAAACGGGSTSYSNSAATSTPETRGTAPTTAAATSPPTAPVVAHARTTVDQLQQATLSAAQPDIAVAITLADYTVTADKQSVKAGTIRFIATNVSVDHIHELVVLKINPDGSFDNQGEIRAIASQQGGAVTLHLQPGGYQLACLITAGQSGSAVDHYQQGMHTDFKVE